MDFSFAVIIQIVLIALLPWVLTKLVNGRKIANILSPVVLAYVAGILIRMSGLLSLDDKVTELAMMATILLAIPLLLFNTDVIAWIKHAKSTVLSFFFCIIAALISATIFGFIFNKYVDKVWEKSGMLVGIYTGGTANLFAVGKGINADPNSMGLLNASEMIWGGIYLIFLTSVLPKFYALFLPDYIGSEENQEETQELFVFDIKQVFIAVLLAIAVIGLTVGLNYLALGDLENNAAIILSLTAISVGFSFVPKIRRLKGSFETGDYFLLMFCVAIGMTFDLGLLVDSGIYLMLYTGSVMLTAILIHLALSAIFKIDRDTTIITSTAAIYGPPFIGQIAQVLKNREVILAGISTGLIGYAVGNFLGISLSSYLQTLLQ